MTKNTGKTATRSITKISSATVVLLLSLLLTPVLVAFVTINVNFPESAVQKATDDYVRDLYRAKEGGKDSKGKVPTAAPTPAKESSGLNLALINEAWAESFKVDSPKSLKIRDRMTVRVDEVLSQKRAGAVGESADGMLVVKLQDAGKKLLIKKLEKLVQEENADRAELYAEVATSNGMGKAQLKDIQRSFARSFQAESPSGTWVQDASGSWSQKP